MKSDIDILIITLEEEKALLGRTIKEALDQHDYLSVYQNGNALNKIEAQLYRLRNLKDPYYEVEERLQRYTDRLRLNDESNEYLLTFWKEQFEQEQIKINELRAHQTPLTDGQEIDDALFDLKECKHKKFRLSFSHRGEPIQLDFEKAPNNILTISINLKSIISEYDPDDPEEQQIHLFENLGFKPDDKAGVIRYDYDMSNFKSAWDIKMMLSRIVYEIGYFGGEKRGTIEFVD